jgi:hypothetical protein
MVVAAIESHVAAARWPTHDSGKEYLGLDRSWLIHLGGPSTGERGKPRVLPIRKGPLVVKTRAGP